MKAIILLCLTPLSMLAQYRIELNGVYKQPLYAPLNEMSRSLKAKGIDTKISNYEAGIKIQVYQKNKWSLHTGLEYSYQNLKLMNIVDTTFFYITSVPPDNIHFKKYYAYRWDKPSFSMISHKLAISLESRYKIQKGNKIFQEVGATVNISFFEYYKSFYYSKELDSLRGNYSAQGGYLSDDQKEKLYLRGVEKLRHNFFLSAVDLNLFYQFNWIISPNFSLGLRASIGTNLYSDWNQFKKYLWACFGLYVAIGTT